MNPGYTNWIFHLWDLYHRKCNEACFESRENGYYKTAILLYNVYSKRNGFFLEETLSNYDKLFILFESLTPTHERLINCLEPCECNALDQKITTWFHRYIRSCSNEQLEKLLRFITASSSLPCDTKIKIQFVNQPPKYLRPHAQTCFKILLIPRQYASFTQLYENFNFYMAHSEYWGVHDESNST